MSEKNTCMQENNIDCNVKKILERIEIQKQKNKNIFLLNLWKNYIKIKLNNLTDSINDCEQFLNKIENNTFENNKIEMNEEISFETIMLIYSLFNTIK